MKNRNNRDMIKILNDIDSTETYPKYIILSIKEKNLLDELNKQDKNGYEPFYWLSIQEPTAYEIDRSYRILFRSSRK
jgi:hypothetical protein